MFLQQLSSFIEEVSIKGSYTSLMPFLNYKDDALFISAIIAETNEISSEELDDVYLSIKRVEKVLNCSIENLLNGSFEFEEEPSSRIDEINAVVNNFRITRDDYFEDNDVSDYEFQFIEGLEFIVNKSLLGENVECDENFKKAYRVLFFNEFDKLYRCVYPDTFKKINL